MPIYAGSVTGFIILNQPFIVIWQALILIRLFLVYAELSPLKLVEIHTREELVQSGEMGGKLPVLLDSEKTAFCTQMEGYYSGKVSVQANDAW